jgi:hypothetical protein
VARLKLKDNVEHFDPVTHLALGELGERGPYGCVERRIVYRIDRPPR